MYQNRVDDFLDDAVTAYSDVATEAVDVDLREIRAALRVDHEMFIEFFLADQLDMPVPEFHGEIWSLLTDQEKERILLAIPRDHAKTTLAKLVVVWYFLYTSRRFCVYLSNTNAIAKGACKDIMEFLQCQNFVTVFGQIKITKASENESLWQFELPMPNGKVKKCILRAIGQGQQMRGINIDNLRPDIAVVDDVEDNENTESELQQKKLDKWIFGPFLKALARKKKILWLGNMLAKTSLLARLSRRPNWNPVVFGCLIKDAETGQLVPLWPGKWTVESLQADFQEYKDNGLIETWMCEMMNMPGHGINGFTSDQINYAPQPTPDECLATWISVDPAFGLRAHNDESAIAVHALLTDGNPMTVCVVHGRWSEKELFLQILAQAQYWNAWTWGIEAVAAQKLLITLFVIFLAESMIPPGLVEMIPLLAGKGDPKVARIRAWVGLMAQRAWAIVEGEIDITTQLLAYNPRVTNPEDDIIDACAYGPIMHAENLALIMAQAAGVDLTNAAKTQSGMEVAGD